MAVRISSLRGCPPRLVYAATRGQWRETHSQRMVRLASREQ